MEASAAGEDEVPAVVEAEVEGVGEEGEAAAAQGVVMLLATTPTSVTSQSLFSTPVAILRRLEVVLVEIVARLRMWSSYMRLLKPRVPCLNSNPNKATVSTIMHVSIQIRPKCFQCPQSHYGRQEEP